MKREEEKKRRGVVRGGRNDEVEGRDWVREKERGGRRLSERLDLNLG